MRTRSPFADSELRSPLSAEPKLFNSAYPELEITNPRLPAVGYVDGCSADLLAATTSSEQWLKSLPRFPKRNVSQRFALGWY